ncbi:MAG TPA: hypothetical protein VGS11_01295 [Candidatus Bathyarchaeia archaeon]|nr:hypothetical protein [Candidatus Bathyarchaeia archaeon]
MKKQIMGIIVVVVIAVAAVLLAPVAFAGNVTVPLTKVTFNETTGSLSFDHPSNTTSSVTAYEYYYFTRPGGWFRTSENKVNASAGQANINITLVFSTPSGGSSLPMQTLSGVALGNRTHTIYISVDQGQRASGTYRLTVTIDAAVKSAGSSTFTTQSPKGFDLVWKVP